MAFADSDWERQDSEELTRREAGLNDSPRSDPNEPAIFAFGEPKDDKIMRLRTRYAASR